jgi:diguanylate cyclase (GGDEF)-like protein
VASAMALGPARDYGATTAVNVLVLVGSAGVVLLTAAGAAVAVARARLRADDRVAEAVRRLAEGMNETIRDLTISVEAAQAVPRPERFAGELAATLDLEEVAQRTLEAAGAIAGVDAVALAAAGPGGDDLATTAGISPEEADRTVVRLPENDNLRAVEVTYRYRIDDVDAAAAVVRSGVVVPMRADGAPIGSLSAFARSSARTLSTAEIEALERLAFRAGPALDNARRYAEARALADLDALTGLHNRRYFHELLAREISRAHRYSRSLTLLVVDLDDFKAVNDRVGHLAGDTALAEVASRLRATARSADVACRIGGDEFAVVLPEATAVEGEQLAERLERAVGGRPVGQAGTVRLSVGVAELGPSESAVELFERADKALYRAKQLGTSHAVANDA